MWDASMAGLYQPPAAHQARGKPMEYHFFLSFSFPFSPRPPSPTPDSHGIAPATGCAADRATSSSLFGLYRGSLHPPASAFPIKNSSQARLSLRIISAIVFLPFGMRWRQPLNQSAGHAASTTKYPSGLNAAHGSTTQKHNIIMVLSRSHGMR
ncbi:hypothetical protein MPH_08575 [Macrophomina phaseolina MS6]|uniref:Uncharacterized protein n=1 Tax=Macrophomina phaseolina (strain MS6) TaxID=1126212 RepID=K2RN45_MACPH|nr:hypothetical protein MPH_08575 [Macrophomina phaseolina MS6]